MRGFRKTIANQWYKNFQQHHIIPIAVLNHPDLRSKFKPLEQHGFSPHDFTANGILLPCTETAAQKYRLPLHRGPHKDYNNLVLECVTIIFSKYDIERGTEREKFRAVEDLARLQASLKAMLRQGKAIIFLNSYDPNSTDVSLQSREDVRASFIKRFETKF
jgi:hypothetical protein